MTWLHDEHAGVLYAFVLRYVDDRDLARDVVQETLLRAWRHLDELDPQRAGTRSYLFTVARNLITDQWRSAQRRPRLVHDDAAMDAEYAPDQLDAAISGWLVTDALERLTPSIGWWSRRCTTGAAASLRRPANWACPREP